MQRSSQDRCHSAEGDSEAICPISCKELRTDPTPCFPLLRVSNPFPTPYRTAFSSYSFARNLSEMKARASWAAAAGLSMKLQRGSVELRQKACADLSKLNLPPDSTAVSFPGIYYLDVADKNKQSKKDHSVMQSNLNCPFVFVL